MSLGSRYKLLGIFRGSWSSRCSRKGLYLLIVCAARCFRDSLPLGVSSLYNTLDSNPFFRRLIPMLPRAPAPLAIAAQLSFRLLLLVLLQAGFPLSAGAELLESFLYRFFPLYSVMRALCARFALSWCPFGPSRSLPLASRILNFFLRSLLGLASLYPSTVSDVPFFIPIAPSRCPRPLLLETPLISLRGPPRLGLLLVLVEVPNPGIALRPRNRCRLGSRLCGDSAAT